MKLTRCWLTGCTFDPEAMYPFDPSAPCLRCGLECESSWNPLTFGFVKPFKRAAMVVTRLRYSLAHECAACGKRMWLTKQHTCSYRCYKNWIPF